MPEWQGAFSCDVQDVRYAGIAGAFSGDVQDVW